MTENIIYEIDFFFLFIKPVFLIILLCFWGKGEQLLLYA